MYNSSLGNSLIAKKSKSSDFKTLQLYSTSKNSKKYYTPFKTNLTTANTNNNTLTITSIISKNKKTASLYCKDRKTNCSKPARNNDKSFFKQKKIVTQSKKGKKKQKKELKSVIFKQNVNLNKNSQKIITNNQIFKGLRYSISNYNTSMLLKKISQIFDLIISDVKLPYQIQTFLHYPIYVMNEKIIKSGKRELTEVLIEFKNNCMKVIRNCNPQDLIIFQRLQLPKNQLWSTPNSTHASKRKVQADLRSKFFQTLKKKPEIVKEPPICQETLDRLQMRLDDYLGRCMKYRKVYF